MSDEAQGTLFGEPPETRTAVSVPVPEAAPPTLWVQLYEWECRQFLNYEMPHRLYEAVTRTLAAWDGMPQESPIP